MIPGSVTRLTEATVASTTSIDQKTDIIRVTGSTAVATIVPQFPNFPGIVVVIPTDGSIVLATTGNILVGITAVINRAVILIWSKEAQKWVINSGV